MSNLGGTGVSENTDFDDEVTDLLARQDRLNPSTLAIALDDSSLQEGDVLRIKDRVNSTWEVVLASSVTISPGSPTVGRIMLSSGDNTLALVHQDIISVNPREYGEIGAGNDDAVMQSVNDESTLNIMALTGLHSVSTLALKVNTVIVGSAFDTINIESGGAGFTATGTLATPIKGIQLLGFNCTGEVGSNDIGTTLFTEDMVIDGVRFTGDNASSVGFNLVMLASDNSRIDNCVFRDKATLIYGSDEGFGDNDGVRGVNNSINNLDMKNATQGVVIRYQNDFTGSNSVSVASTTTFACGFLVEKRCQNVTLNHCFAHGHVRSGFYVEGGVALGIKGVHFNNCYGYDNGEAGLVLTANFENVVVSGGGYYENTGTFGAGTGHGILAANSFDVNISGAQIYGNVSDGIKYTNGFKFNVVGNSIHDNGGFGVSLPGAPSTVKIIGNLIRGNASGDVNNMPTDAGSEFDDDSWVDFVPIFTKQNGTTVVATQSLYARRRKVGRTVFLEIYATFNSGDLDAQTFFTIPFTGNWTSTSDEDAKAMRGVAYTDGSTFAKVTGIFNNAKLNVNPTTNTTTEIGVTATYETTE